MQLWDLSYPLTPETPVPPPFPAPKIVEFATMEEHGYRMSDYAFRNHSGTHIDAPSHYVPQGRTLDEIALTRLIAPAHILRLNGDGTVVGLDGLEQERGPVGAIFLETGWSQYWGSPEYFHGFPYLTSAEAQRLAGLLPNFLGIDAFSYDPLDTTDFANHAILLGAGIPLVENIPSMAGLPSELLVGVFPLKVGGANGSPCRVVGVPLNPWPGH